MEVKVKVKLSKEEYEKYQVFYEKHKVNKDTILKGEIDKHKIFRYRDNRNYSRTLIPDKYIIVSKIKQKIRLWK